MGRVESIKEEKKKGETARTRPTRDLLGICSRRHSEAQAGMAVGADGPDGGGDDMGRRGARAGATSDGANCSRQRRALAGGKDDYRGSA